MFSENALNLYALKKEEIVKSNAAFWRGDEKMLQSSKIDLRPYARELDEHGMSIICALDKDFPSFPLPIRASERPYLFAYRGDISLLKNLDQNVAVVGVLDPSEEIIVREKYLSERE